MLRKLTIQNLALISNAELVFKPGLNIISGETGSGKSIVIQAISALQGNPADKNSLKANDRPATIEGVFDTTCLFWEQLKRQNMDFTMEDATIMVIRREIHTSGRSRYFINDQLAAKNEFEMIGRMILDINSQHSHQLLLNTKNHLAFLDHAIGLGTRVRDLEDVYDQLIRIGNELRIKEKKAEEIDQRRRLIAYQIKEIDDAHLEIGEKERLVSERERLRYADEIRQSIAESVSILSEGDISIGSLLSELRKNIHRMVRRDASLEPILAQAESISLVAEDIQSQLQTVNDSIEFSPARLDDLSQRLHLLQDLEGKYRNDISGIIQYRTIIEEELIHFESSEREIERLRIHWKELLDEYQRKDREISTERRTRSPELCRAIERELAFLGMKEARFEVVFSDPWDWKEFTIGRMPEHCTPAGTDTVDFLLSANPGIPLKPLSRVASGGELSRIMLALKQHLSNSIMNPTIVFDEVDAGIGGETALGVAGQLHKLASGGQVICVTHLPQIAARAEHHLSVLKYSHGESTDVEIHALDESERIREIARMLSGLPEEEQAVTHAKALIEATHSEKMLPESNGH